MKLGITLQQKMGQQLVMTPQLQQAIKLLQLSHHEIVEHVQDALLENPLLELAPTSTAASRGTAYTDRPAAHEFTAAPVTLHDHLRKQIRLANLEPDVTAAALLLIDDINDNGYLDADAQQTVSDMLPSLATHSIEDAITQLQQCSPIGIAARNLQECLLLQLAHSTQHEPITQRLITHHLELLQKRQYPRIAKEMQIELADIAHSLRVIQRLEPKPGRVFNHTHTPYITPDLYLHRAENRWVISNNDDGMPNLQLSQHYQGMLPGSQGDTKTYLNEHLRQAQWLLRSLHMRRRTLRRVLSSIVKFQHDFFMHGSEFLRPLVLRQIAEDVELHESTISRVTTRKYVQTPSGLYELKYFFNSSIACVTGQENIASESVRHKISALIAQEDPHKPLSDSKITRLLAHEDIRIARRTVAKYRDMLQIPLSSERRQILSAPPTREGPHRAP